MAYQVLARKWRPQNFSQIVGQEHVTKSLINALQHQRLHHAYLFTGTRGVGKTTIARILAKAINCENLQDFNPCGECAVCNDFDNGRFMDLIEVDAASRTKVEDTRDLLDNAQYAPNQGCYKVYLIDEVHMLSGHSFNALLKTLEEPPAHVKFLLATTDPQKIPVTVLSRCLQFNLKPLLVEQISQQMDFILKQEKIAFDSSALNLIARASDGSMRDGLSLLDQAISYGQGQVNQVDVSTMLGTVAQQPIDDLLNALVDADGKALLDKIANIADLSVDFSQILQQLLRLLHRIALLQKIPNLKQQEFDPQILADFSTRISPEDLQLYYQIGLVGQKDLDLAPDSRSGFEMLMLRILTFRPTRHNSPSPQYTAPVKTTPPTPKQTPVVSHIATITQEKYPPERVSAPQNITPPLPLENTPATPNNWEQMIAAMNLAGLTKQLANNCVLANVDDINCTLLVDSNFMISGTKSKENPQTALQKYYARPLKLIITTQTTQTLTPALEQKHNQEQRQHAAETSIHNDQNINALKETFDAQIIQGSIAPLDPTPHN